ncbi:MAG: hypothetical protein JNM40_09295 [Myxococcales bacterium]|nr:hypothetical protein [Myxococcales bacterium]
MTWTDRFRRILPWVATSLFGCLHFQPIDRPLSDDISERAAIIDRAQHHGMSRREELVVTKVLLATHGEDLMRLKRLIEHGPDRSTLHELIYQQISDDVLRQAILAHLVRESRSELTPPSHPPREKVRVLSDIDDTLYSSLCDERFRRRTLFPGVLEFYRALSIGVRAHDSSVQAKGDVTFLSARPRELASLSYSSTLNPLFAAHSSIIGGYSLLPAPRAYSGIGNVHEVQAFAKFRNFVQYAALYPEADFVFIGDSGQGDLLSGELMLYHQPERLRAVFIHQIVTGQSHGMFCPYPRSVKDMDQGISHLVFFDTYVGAALQAFEWGLISEESLLAVAQATVRTLNQRGTEIVNPPHRSLVVGQFRRDLRRAQEVLDRQNDSPRERLPELLFGDSACSAGTSPSAPSP